MSLRAKLMLTFVALMTITSAGTLWSIHRSLSADLVAALDARLTNQARGVAEEMAGAGHPARLAPRLANVTGARITVVGANGLIQSDSLEPQTVGRPIGDAPEIARARRGGIGREIRRLRDDEPL